MPRHRSPGSLKSLCLTLIIDTCLSDEEGAEILEPQLLPAAVVSQLFEEIHTRQLEGTVGSNQIAMLVGRFGHMMEELRLEVHKDRQLALMSTGSLLETVANNTNPTHFRYFSIIGHHIAWDVKILASTLTSLSGLMYLKLYTRGLSDVIMKAISVSCRQLKELYLQGMNFSDGGLLSLAGNVCSSGLRDSSGCFLLRVISLTSESDPRPRFSYFSIACLLELLPHLQVLLIPDQCFTTALIYMSSSFKKQLPLTSYQGCFSTIDYSTATLAANHLEKICCLCPNLKTVNITYDFSLEPISCLSHLQHLHSLILTRTQLTDYKLDTESMRGIYCLLEKIGSKLYHFEFHGIYLSHGINAIDVRTIGYLCPNLDTLELSNVTSITDAKTWSRFEGKVKSKGREVPLLPCLKSLKLLAHSENKITRADLVHGFGASHGLEHLFIGWCESFDDEAVEHFLSFNQLKACKSVVLQEISPWFTANGLYQMIGSASECSKISLLGCPGISQSDINQLIEYVQEDNLELTIKYYCD